MVWTPSDLPDLHAWYDASDECAVVSSGGKVSQLTDKSGNGRHATQGTPANRPSIGVETVNGRDVVSYLAGTQMDLPEPFGISGSQNRSMFFMFRLDSEEGAVPGIFEQDAVGPGEQWALRPLLGDLWLSVNAGAITTAFPLLNNSIIGAILDGNRLDDTTLYQNGVGELGTSIQSLNTQDTDNNLGKQIDGVLGEAVFTLEAMSEADRFKTEGYMAWKWGLVEDLPYNHPYRYDGTLFGFGFAVFVPSDLPSILAWYDASDDSTITQAAGKVSQWWDKSGNGEHIANPTGANQPQYSGACITFDGVNDMLFRASRFGLATNPDLTVATVAYKPSFVNIDDFSWMIGAAPAGNSDTLGGSTGTDGWAWRHQGGNNVFGPVTLSTYEVAVWQRAAGSDYQSSSFRLNGSDEAATSSSNPTGVPLSTAAYFSIGSSYDPIGNIKPASISYLDIVIAETDDVDEAQFLEGYLAWKRGLESQLPIGHPYKTDGSLFLRAAFSSIFDPANGGLQVDLDASATLWPEAATYSWDFGDTNTGSGVTPSHTYAAEGTYTISLTVSSLNATPQTVTKTVLVSFSGIADQESPRPVYLRLEDDSGDLLLEDGVSALLLEESANQLFWNDNNGDGDWGRRDAFVFDADHGTLNAVPTLTRYWRIVIDACPNATAKVGAIYLDNPYGANRAPNDLTSNTGSSSYTASTTATSTGCAYKAFDGTLTSTIELAPTEYIQLTSDDLIGASRVGIFFGDPELYASEWHVEVSDDGTNFRTVGTVNSGADDVGLNRTNTITVDAGRVTTTFRYWRLTSTTDEGAAPNISDFALYDEDGTRITPDNMTTNALPAPFTASASSESGTDLAYQAFDGDATGTSWEATASPAGEYLQIDLGSSIFANQLSIVQPTAAKPGWTLSGSDDGVTFTDVMTVPDNTAEDTYNAVWPNYLGTRATNYETLTKSISDQVVYFPFGASGVADVSGNALTLSAPEGVVTVAGAPATLTSTASARFDAADSVLTVNGAGVDDASYTTRSVSCWFRFPEGTVFSGKKVIYGQGGATDGANIYLDGDRIWSGFWTAGGSDAFSQSNTVVTANKWFHVVSVYDGEWAHLYVNGRYQHSSYCGVDIAANTDGGALPTIGALNNDSAFHDGDQSSGGVGTFTLGVGQDFLVSDFCIHDQAMSASDAAMLFLTGRTTNAINKQDDVVIFASGLSQVAADTQSQGAAMTAFNNIAQPGADTIAVQQFASIAPATTSYTSTLDEYNTIEAGAQLVVGAGATLGNNNSESGNWLDGDLVLMGSMGITRGDGVFFRGAGNIVVAAADATISTNTISGTHINRFEVPVTDDLPGVGFQYGQSKLTIGPITTIDPADTLYYFDIPNGAKLFFDNMDIVGGARVRWEKPSDADADMPGTTYVQNGELLWNGVDGAHGASWGGLIVDAAGTVQFGTSGTDVPDWDIDMTINGGTVRFQEFSGASTVAFQGSSDWTMTADTVFDVNMAANDPLAALYRGTATGAFQMTFNMDGVGGWAWANPTADPGWTDTIINSDDAPYVTTSKSVSMVYEAATEPLGVKSRSFGSGAITLNDAIFWLGRYEPGIANRVELQNEINFVGYGEVLGSSTNGADAPSRFDGQWDITGIAYFYVGNGSADVTWELFMPVLFDQGGVGTRRFVIEQSGSQNTSITGPITEDAGGAGNTVEMVSRNEAATSTNTITSDLPIAVLEFESDSSDGVFVLDDIAIVGNVTNVSANLQLSGTLDITGSYRQDGLAAADLDMNSGTTMNVSQNFFIDSGSVSNLDGSTFTSATWEVREIDMIGATEWYVQTSLTRPFFYGPGTLTWSDATGSPNEGVIVLPTGIDGGNNTFWIPIADTDSPHIFNPDGGVFNTRWDLRWVQAFHVDGDITRVSFWGDSTPRVEFNTTLFQAQWMDSRINNPRMPWMGDLTVGTATLTISGSTWNLLHVDNWYILSSDPDKVGVRFCGVESELAAHSADGMEPVVIFDRATFEAAMNSFTVEPL